MNVPPTHVLTERGPVSLLVRRDWAADLPVEALLAGAERAAWGQDVAETLTSGRGLALVLATPRGHIVAKQLSRGGLLGGLFRYTYFDRWRCVREADVAERLAAVGCPTPPVVVARATRNGWGWRLELATARVTGAQDLYVALAAGADVASLAAAAGRSVARLHQAGLRHRDLTVENLLTGGDPDASLTVIDLDRCSLTGAPLPRGERVASLARLARSAVRRGLFSRGGPLDAESCSRFLAAYTEARGQPEPDLGPAVAARVRRHLSLWGRTGVIPGAG